MDNELLRQELLSHINDLLSHSFLVTGKNRALLLGLRGYVAAMEQAELTRLGSFMVEERKHYW